MEKTNAKNSAMNVAKAALKRGCAFVSDRDGKHQSTAVAEAARALLFDAGFRCRTTHLSRLSRFELLLKKSPAAVVMPTPELRQPWFPSSA